MGGQKDKKPEDQISEDRQKYSKALHRHLDWTSVQTWTEVSVSPQGPESRSGPPSVSHLGLALEVEGEDVLSTPRLALPDQEHPVARRASSQNQLGRFEAGQGPVEPLALAERVLHGLGRAHVREQEGTCRTGT